MNANELADVMEKYSVAGFQYPLCEEFKQAAIMLRQQQAENNAFRKELFKIGSMRSCSQAAALHGFVSPAQAGDDAREYIAEILRKAQDK